MNNWLIVFICLAFGFGIFNVWLTLVLHENLTFFSHLNEIEREITFKTEMGFYYSFYKQIVHNVSFSKLLRDFQTEFPNPINSLQRFNLVPELILGFAYRFLHDYTSFLQSECYLVKRELTNTISYAIDPKEINLIEHRRDGLNVKIWKVEKVVNNCVGLKEPSIFYTKAIFFLVFLTPFSLALSAYFLNLRSGCNYLGVIATLLVCGTFISLQDMATRVQWTPPLRESWAYPFFIFQQSLLIKLIISSDFSWKTYLLFGFAQLGFQLPWQFSQFALSTQVLAVLGAYLLVSSSDIPEECNIKMKIKASRIFWLHLFIFCISYILQFGNCLLITSLYPAVLFTAICSTMQSKKPIIGIYGFISVIFRVLFTLLLASTTIGYIAQSPLFKCDLKDGSHIIELLKLKILGPLTRMPTLFRTFHTQLYVCSQEFDYFEFREFRRLCLKVPVLPLSFLYCGYKFFEYFSTNFYKPTKNEGSSPKKINRKQDDTFERFVNFYMILQFFVFFFLASLISRLKLFFTPHLCLMLALWCQKSSFKWMKNYKFPCLIILTALIANYAHSNVKQILGHYGNDEDQQVEVMFNWFKELPKKPNGIPWILTGPMTTSSYLRDGLIAINRLPNESTFAVTNHPHYENFDLRIRTILAYSIYSRMPLRLVWYIYSKVLKTDFLLVEAPWCFQESGEDCRIGDLYKLVSKEELQSMIGDGYSAEYEPGPYLCEFFRMNFKANKLYTNGYPYFTEVFSDTDRFRLLLKVNHTVEL